MELASLDGTPASAGSAPGRPAAPGKYMSFRLGGGLYGLEIGVVREIIGLLEITRIPRTAPHIRGVINLRGVVIPVVDLGRALGMDPVDPTEQTVIIVVQYGAPERGVVKGVLVDEVVEVLDLTRDSIAAPPRLAGGSQPERLMRGVGHAGGRVVFLLDIERILEAQGPDEAAGAGAPAGR